MMMLKNWWSFWWKLIPRHRPIFCAVTSMNYPSPPGSLAEQLKIPGQSMTIDPGTVPSSFFTVKVCYQVTNKKVLPIVDCWDGRRTQHKPNQIVNSVFGIGEPWILYDIMPETNAHENKTSGFVCFFLWIISLSIRRVHDMKFRKDKKVPLAQAVRNKQD